MIPPAQAPSYRAVLRTSFARRTLLLSLVGRLSYGTVFLSLTLAVTSSTRSYGPGRGRDGRLRAGQLAAGTAARRAHRPARSGPAAAAHGRRLLAAAGRAGRRHLGARNGRLAARPAGRRSGRVRPAARPGDAHGLQRPAGRHPDAPTRLQPGHRLRGTAVRDRAVDRRAPRRGGRNRRSVSLSARPWLLAGTLAFVHTPLVRAARTAPAAPHPAAPMAARRARHMPLPQSLPRGPLCVAAGLGLVAGALSLFAVVFAGRHGQFASVAWIEAALAVGSAVGGLATEAAPGAPRPAPVFRCWPWHSPRRWPSRARRLACPCWWPPWPSPGCWSPRP